MRSQFHRVLQGLLDGQPPDNLVENLLVDRLKYPVHDRGEME